MNYSTHPRALPLRMITLVGVIAMLVVAARPSSQGSNYTVYTTDGRRSLPFRSSGGTDMVPLAQVATIFNVTVAEDSLVGGLTVRGRGQTILLIPGQSFASIGPGRIVSLPGPIERDRGAWQVPVDFITLALGPSLNVRTELRRAKRVLLVGDVRLPQVSGRFERQGANGRLVLEVQPATPHRVTRQGNRLIVRFEAAAIDFTPVTGLVAALASAVRAEGTSLLIDLGPEAVGYREDDLDPTHLAITLTAPAPAAPAPPPPAPTPAPAATPAPTPPPGPLPVPGTPVPASPGAPVTPEATPLPVVEAGGGGTLRTIVIDPGHGGDDVGTRGPGGTLEKNYVLAFARRLKATIEGRIGLRVLLTRNTDENVPLDRRASLANNNKADLFISLHANGAIRPSVRGSQVLSLRLNDYAGRSPDTGTTDLPVAFLGGGTRTIDVLPWDLAQIGFTDRSAAAAAILTRHLTEAKVPIFTGPTAELPLRPLVGANMPAIMFELGFLTSPDDEREMNGSSHSTKLLEAVLRTIADIRRGALLSAGVDGQ